MKFSLRTLLWVVLAAAVAGALVYGFRPPVLPVDLARIDRGPLRVTVDEDGITRVKERYVISAPLGGRLSRVEVEPGTAVERHTLLAIIEPQLPEMLDARAVAAAEARVEAAEAALQKSRPVLERARAELELARSELARIEQLAQANAASTEQLERAQTAARTRAYDMRAAASAELVARFEVDVARAALLQTRNRSGEHFEVRSPIDGRVLDVFQESATVVQAGTQLLEIGDWRDLEIVVDVLSSDAVKIEAGNEVTIEHWGGPTPLAGIVRLVEPQGFTKLSALGVEEQRVNVIIDLLDPTENRRTLGAQYRVEPRIVIWQQDDVLKVPTSALFRSGDDWAVFVVADGVAETRHVRIGQRSATEAEVLGGLEAGMRVVTHPGDRIADGTAVSERPE